MKIRTLDETKATMRPEVVAAAEAEARELLASMPLYDLRAALRLTQKMVAEVLGIKQPTYAKMERQTDMYLSSLRNIIRAMGGELEIVARFPGGDVRIEQFHDIEAREGVVESVAKAASLKKADRASRKALAESPPSTHAGRKLQGDR